MTKISKVSNRGVALLMTISVLAILTILVGALAYSAGMATQQEKVAMSKTTAGNLAGAGFDLAVSALARVPGGITAKQEMAASFPTGECRMTAAPADPKDTIYGGAFIKPRPGDLILTVTASQKRTSGIGGLTRSYLINLDPNRPRRVMFNEKVELRASSPAPAAPKGKA